MHAPCTPVRTPAPVCVQLGGTRCMLIVWSCAGIKLFVAGLLDGESFDSSELVDLVLAQSGDVGTVVKVKDKEEVCVCVCVCACVCACRGMMLCPSLPWRHLIYLLHSHKRARANPPTHTHNLKVSRICMMYVCAGVWSHVCL